MAEPIVILHLSDLHFGENSRFSKKDPKDLGDELGQAVEEEAKRRKFAEKPDLVIVTGDIAQKALPSEYKQALGFFDGLVGRMGLDRERFVFLPGNHDVSWSACKRVEASLEGEEITEDQLKPTMDKEKFGPFEKFKSHFFDGAHLSPPTPLARGAFVHDFSDLRVSVAALNSCEEETHESHVGEFSREQAESLMRHWSTSPADGWIKIAAIHHNPDSPPTKVVDEYRQILKKVRSRKSADKDAIDHYLADLQGFQGRDRLLAISNDRKVQLILHGHQHADARRFWPWEGDEHVGGYPTS